MPMVLRVPVRAMMDMMGWSAASTATHYTHVPDEVRHEYAAQLGGRPSASAWSALSY